MKGFKPSFFNYYIAFNRVWMIEELLNHFLRELGSDYILKDVLCWKGSLIFTAYNIWGKSFVEALNDSKG